MLQNINKIKKTLKNAQINADIIIVRKYARKELFSTMGMAASQGRLLFMTARISNNEFEQQSVAYSKQRLADDSQEANDRYLEALQATQYQVLTGYNGDSATYEPVTYNQLTALNSVAARKQYIVSDNKGQILVTDKIARAFDPNYKATGANASHQNVDFNTFLKNVSNPSEGILTQVSETSITEADVHDAWDKYFASINRGVENGIYYDATLGIQEKHILGFGFNETKPTDESGKPIAGAPSILYSTYETAHIEGKNGGKNLINLQRGLKDDSTSYYYYVNNEVEVESYLDELGDTKYIAKYKPNDILKTGTNRNYNLMENDGYVYLENVEVTMSGGQYIYKVNGQEIDTSSSNGKIYVDQDYGTDVKNPTAITNKKETPVAINEDNIVVKPIFYEGSTAEQRELYDYAMAVSEKYAKGSEMVYDADKVQYYKNIYQQMITKGFTTFDQMIEEKYINTMSYKTASGDTSALNNEKLAYCNDNWLITLLKNGKLSIAFYDITNNNFVKTTLDDDESIVEKENKSKMAIAEQVYQNHMDKIESEDKRFDMQLSKLESEHTALTTEYESVSKVISKNVEKSFNIFNA